MGPIRRHGPLKPSVARRGPTHDLRPVAFLMKRGRHQRANQRGSMLERHRPVMQSWADFLTGSAKAKFVPLRKRS
jgi:hypothetical protein